MANAHNATRRSKIRSSRWSRDGAITVIASNTPIMGCLYRQRDKRLMMWLPPWRRTVRTPPWMRLWQKKRPTRRLRLHLHLSNRDRNMLVESKTKLISICTMLTVLVAFTITFLRFWDRILWGWTRWRRMPRCWRCRKKTILLITISDWSKKPWTCVAMSSKTWWHKTLISEYRHLTSILTKQTISKRSWIRSVEMQPVKASWDRSWNGQSTKLS